MDAKEILNFCLKNGLLLDREVLTLFGEEDTDSVKLIIEKIKSCTQKKVITKDLIISNKEQFNQFFSSLPKESKEKFEKLKIKLGLSIEISKEISESGELNNVNEDASVSVLTTFSKEGKKIEVSDFINYFRNRFSEMKGFLQNNPAMENLVSINKLSGARQGVSLIGIVYDKKVTKNKNIIFEIEDLTGRTKVLVNKNKPELYEKAEDVALDAVVGFKCSGTREMLFANDIIFPEIRILERKKSPKEEYALFLGDIHYGSKNFLKEKFEKFIDYLNGELSDSEEVENLKYLFILGDLITGVGVYPDQEKDLAVPNLEEQYIGVSKLLSRIRKDIKIIISPGNHEGIRLMEPQPIYNEKYAWALYGLPNVILTENPAVVNIAKRGGFPGINVLTYHGFSYPYYADNAPKLMQIKAMNSPEKIMQHLLKHRHLAPTHGSVQYFPYEEDVHIIRDAPDIFASGHTHKASIVYYNNILIISCATWESMTPYQEKFGNVPDYCKVPMVNLKTRAIKILDFE